MILSMTGFGSGRCVGAGIEVAAEARSVNGRFLKLSFRLPPRLTSREHELEALVREQLRRGSVTIRMELRAAEPKALVAVNEDVVRAYQEVFRRLGVDETPLATLPGVLGRDVEEMSDEELAVAKRALAQALESLTVMRGREGEALARVLLGQIDRIAELAARARSRAPFVSEEYRAKLRTRLAQLVHGFGNLPTDEALLAREVAVLADRCDITEELDRLGTHLQQVRSLIAKGGDAGRTLEFLAQELHREINTLSAKSADAELARVAVELKAELERFREQIANVE